MLQLTINRTSWLEFREAMARHETFKTHGNLFAQRGYHPAGRLPQPWFEQYVSRDLHIDYVVVSYGTPIAWHDDERGWIMPDVKYSMTTSKAQGRIRPGIHSLQESGL